MLKAKLNPIWRAGLFWTVVNVSVMTAAWRWCERETWLWIVPIALSINFIWWSYGWVLQFRGWQGEVLSGQDPWGILKIIHQRGQELNLPVPQVTLVTSASAQIFTYGRRPRHPQMFLTTGLLELLSPAELQAVLTYQLLCAGTGLSVIYYLLAALLDMVFRLGRVLERGAAFLLGWNPPLAVLLAAPILWLTRVLLLSRRDIEKLDERTAHHLRNSEDLAKALWKMEAYAHTRPWPNAWVCAHMCMVNPWLPRRFPVRTPHPRLADRLTFLTGRFPL